MRRALTLTLCLVCEVVPLVVRSGGPKAALLKAVPRRRYQHQTIDGPLWKKERRRVCVLYMAAAAAASSVEAPLTAQEKKQSLEEAEWAVLLVGLDAYKAQFGNLRVPTRFKVPVGDAAWPEETWGLRLGNKVAGIRSQGKYVSHDESRRELLDAMGFEWRLRRLRRPTVDAEVETWEMFLAALETYVRIQDQEKAVPPPKSFVVPRLDPWPPETRGLPLGQSVANLKAANLNADKAGEPKHPYFDDTKGVTLEMQDQRLAMLQSLGLRLKKIEDAVADQKIQMQMDIDKVVDEDGVSSTPSHHNNKKKTFGDETDPKRKATKNDEAFEFIVASLAVFRRLNGHARVPQVFVVPDEAPWPDQARGMALGLRLSKIRLNGSYVKGRPDRARRLMKLGFEDLEQWAESSSESIDIIEDPSSEDYYAFEEEEDDEVPEPPRAVFIPLSADFNDEDVISREQIARQRELGWDFDEFDGDFHWHDVIQGLQEFHRRYGHFHVPEKFVVGQEMTEEDYEDEDDRREKRMTFSENDDDDDDDDLGEDTDLDAALAALLAAPDANDEPTIEDLLALEASDDDDNKEKTADLFDDELRRMLGGEDEDHEATSSSSDEEEEEEEDTGRRKKIRLGEPLIADPWPERLEGLKLGFIVASIRCGDIEAWDKPSRKADLDKINFDWGDREIYLDGIQWHHYLACLFSYSKIKGSLWVQWDFVIPDEDPWPMPIRNEPLGLKTNRLRAQEAKLRKFFKYRAQLLDAMGFVWLPPIFEAPPYTPDTRLPPCLRLENYELEITREDRRRMSKAKKAGTVKDANFTLYVLRVVFFLSSLFL